MKTPFGVLVMAYGAPSSLEEVPGYLADIRSGRPTPKAVLEEILENYRSIGSRSPLLEISRAQMEALESRFDPRTVRFYLGMRHWSPWIEESVQAMAEDGIQRAVSLVLAPHYSALSVARYRERIEAGMKLSRTRMEWKHIMSYHNGASLIEALVNRVREGLERWPLHERPLVHTVFSAHSLPVRIIQQGDPYQTQLWETAELVASGAGLRPDQWSWSYQSAGRTPEPWLGPALDDHLTSLAASGVQNVLSMPIGFVSDHVEILHDIDHKARATCEALGIRLERPPSLNTDPLFIDELEKVVREKLDLFP